MIDKEEFNCAEPFVLSDELYKEFKKEYANATDMKLESFNFMGNFVYTKFAYYLLIYVEMERNRTGRTIIKPRVEVLK